MNDRPQGPYTLWVDYGCEGWRWTDFAYLEQAVHATKYTDSWVIQSPCHYVIVTKDEKTNVYEDEKNPA